MYSLLNSSLFQELLNGGWVSWFSFSQCHLFSFWTSFEFTLPCYFATWLVCQVLLKSMCAIHLGYHFLESSLWVGLSTSISFYILYLDQFWAEIVGSNNSKYYPQALSSMSLKWIFLCKILFAVDISSRFLYYMRRVFWIVSCSCSGGNWRLWEWNRVLITATVEESFYMWHVVATLRKVTRIVRVGKQ